MSHDEQQRGTAYAFLAYGIWGLFPLYFHALAPAGAFEILAHRILWTLVFCVAVLLARRDLAWARPLVHTPRLAAGVTAAGLLIGTNWVIYVYAVLHGLTYEAALGYFLNPIVTVALGVLVLRERLRRWQWVAVGVGAAAAVYLAFSGGGFPVIAVSLALSFGSYGLVKKRVGATLQAMHSLAAETTVLAPIAVVILVVVSARGDATLVGHGGGHTALLLLAGIVTAVPLLLFAASARRIPLVTVGLIQFVTPVLQLMCGVFLLGEHVTPGLWVGFGIVWVALVILTVDSVQAARSGRAETGPPLAEPEAAGAD